MEKKLQTLAALATIIGTLLTICVLFFGDNIYQQMTGRSIYDSNPTYTVGLPSETPAPVATITVSNYQQSSVTPEPSLTPTKDFTLTPMSLSVEITNAKGVSMRLVPAGEFTMGSDSEPDEKPAHTVSLNAFYIDKYEVTNALYKACVDAGACNAPSESKSYTRASYYGNSQFDNYPVIYVDWKQAKTYCEWHSARLPSEAEWEKAARGTDEHVYPWGNDAPNSALLNYNSNVGDTTAVGTYQNGASPFGIYDMAGNVWEWVNDWYSESYYASSPASNPLGPSIGQYRVLRGGSWSDNYYLVRSAVRINYYYIPASRYNIMGFRCALSP